MDINFNFLNKFKQAITHLFISSPSHKTESHDAEKGVISLYTIAKNSPNIQSQRALMGTVSCPSFVTGDNFVGREQQQQQMREIIELWCQRQGELTAVIVPSGAGLSAFLAQVMSLLTTMHNDISAASQNKSLSTPKIDSSSSTSTLHIKPLPEQVLYMSFYQAPLSAKEAIANICYCFNIAPPDTITDAIKLINQQNSQLIIIDDVHKLMIRMMGNSQALMTFATIMMETRKQHCWLLGCETYTWQRLSAQYQIGHLVSNLLEFNYFNAKELAQIQTQQLDKLGLINTEQHVDVNSVEAKPAQVTDKEPPFEDQLKQLYSISQGHPALALLLLQYSLNHQVDINADETKQENEIKIYQINISALKNCKDSDLFSLAEIYVHGGLRVHQHAHIFTISIEKSILQLEYLVRQGLLQVHYSEQDFVAHYYRITPLLTNIIAIHLINNNKLFH
ncbi:hypothetical protein [Shewanella sp. MEBiC00475]|uniref:hypothetical protein n=1 Tax=Shewanella sp. MEBiC00475 TaxID=2575361 RepID=UPI0010C0426A|nr:hypothetical protein [Shewanella sp. MEBiC00475]